MLDVLPLPVIVTFPIPIPIPIPVGIAISFTIRSPVLGVVYFTGIFVVDLTVLAISRSFHQG